MEEESISITLSEIEYKRFKEILKTKYVYDSIKDYKVVKRELNEYFFLANSQQVLKDIQREVDTFM